MILAVDVGNTNIVLGYMEGTKVTAVSRIETDRSATAELFAERVENAMRKVDVDPKQIDRAILSSVVPEVNENVIRAVEKVTGSSCCTVDSCRKTDMPVLLDHPETLAMDLIAGCVGAKAQYPLPLIVIDMGTATTIVVVDQEGNYRGGAIMPGVKLSMKALANGTSLLMNVEMKAPKHCIATNTVDSLQSGAIFGAAAMLDGMIDRMEKELGTKTTAVATGGLAGCVVPHCEHNIQYEPNLLLQGLAVLLEKNS